MKSLVVIIPLLIGGCSVEQTEEFAFKKTMEYQLKDICEEESKASEECIEAVEEQIESCMEKSDWRKYLKNDEDQEEMQRFISEFFPCFKDSNGNSFFGKIQNT